MTTTMTREQLTIVNNNLVVLDGERLTVDRKFHDGFLNYVSRIRAPLLSVHPLGHDKRSVMDPVTLDMASLPYRVLGLAAGDPNLGLAPAETARLRDAVAASAAVYGYGYGVHELAHALGVPYVACLEYDLGTQLDVVRLGAPDQLRAAVRVARAATHYYRRMVPAMRASCAIHVNGYPMAREAAKYQPNLLMYLDSRMRSEMVMSEAALEARLAARTGRPLRLLYSGRYERVKGADDAVRVALECLQRGLDVEMDCYGQGSLAQVMRDAVAAAGKDALARVRVHDAVPFAELVSAANRADVFVCCHLQSDPSCTYLESMGSGLAIAGYANRMWSQMCAQSGAGAVAAQRTPAAVADIVQRWLREPDALADASRRARAFAKEHCFEAEFKRRTDALNDLLEKTKTPAA
jgi:glycosyltransferase involved in cell wall biosynthesis